MKNFSTWPGNYTFGYICAWAALVVGAGLLLSTVLLGRPALDGVMGGLVAAGGAVLVVAMPGWALDAQEEEAARRRAREARRGE